MFFFRLNFKNSIYGGVEDYCVIINFDDELLSKILDYSDRKLFVVFLVCYKCYVSKYFFNLVF